MKTRILADSTSWVNNRLTTFICQVPTVKLAEIRTHRLFSQFEAEYIETAGNDGDMSMNANSSRAIPIEDQLELLKTPYRPTWTSLKRGMQGPPVRDGRTLQELGTIWNSAIISAAGRVQQIARRGIHKQNCSLLLNPFTYTTVILTGDENAWESFFKLRCPEYEFAGESFRTKKEIKNKYPETNELEDPDFDKFNKSMVYPDIQRLVEKMYSLYIESTPEYLKPGDWHIATTVPYEVDVETAIKISVSQMALISYDNQHTQQSVEKHVERYERLIRNKHWSTAEHQYQVPTPEELVSFFSEGYVLNSPTPIVKVATYHRGKFISNVKGWIQLRKMIESKDFR